MVRRKPPYVKKYGEAYGFDVWIVDGGYIRANVDKEFTNFGHNLKFGFIPRKEFWIDKEHGKGSEVLFFIEHMIVEYMLMEQGWNYIDAMMTADAMERGERRKSARMGYYAADVHKKMIKKYSNKVNVWLVDGERVRSLFFISFTEGGHDLVYPFVPKKEVWIDDDVDPYERRLIILHELHERNLMARSFGRGYHDWKHTGEGRKRMYKIYKIAHHASSELEYSFRRNPRGLEKQLMKEVR